MRTIVMLLLLTACDRIVYVYPDGYVPTGDGGTSDVSPPEDAGTDAPEPSDVPRGSCSPDRSTPVSHADCRGLSETPVCDAILERCVPAPTSLCGACETDAQCADVDVRARCVALPGDVLRNQDSVCLVPCDDGCSWVGPEYDWNTTAACLELPAGSFCAPAWGPNPTHCREGEGRTGS